MSKIVATRASLLEMAQKCARIARNRGGSPTLEDAAEYLEQASFRVAELERRLEAWESFGDRMRLLMPAPREDT